LNPIAGKDIQASASCDGFGNGNGRKRAAFKTVNMAVVAPSPMASVNAQAIVKLGVRRRERNATVNDRSGISIFLEEDSRVNA
jgi:hypothetical protein